MKTVLHEMQVGKRLIGLLSMLAFAVLSWGENIRVSMDDFSILPGETHQVAINVTSDVVCGSAFEGIIDLPAGLTIVPDADEGEYVIKNTERCSRKFSLLSASSLENASLQPNQVKFSMYSSNGDNLAGTSGAVLYFTVRASEELAEDSQIRLIESKIKGNNPSSSEPALSVSCAANVHNATFVAAVMNLTAPSFTLTPTKEYDLTFSFEKNKDVISFQADITLPAGMSFVADASGDYVVFNEARLTSSHVFDTNLLNGDKTLRIMLYHPKNTPIKLDEGEFFTVKVKADAALAASAVVSVSKMEFVQNASQLYHPADFTVAVSNPDVAAKAEADAALLQLNTSFEEVKKTIAGYAESVQTKFQAEVETINLSIASLVETLAQDVANGDVFANASTRNAAIEKVSVQISQLSVDAAAAAANEAQYKADVAAIAEVQAQFDAAKKTVTGYAESVQASFAETIAALETSVADLTKTAKASYVNGTSVADAAALQKAVAAVVDNIEKLLVDAAAAQKAYEEEAEKIAANEEQYEANLNMIASLQNKFDLVLEKIAGYDESVQEIVDIDIKTIRVAIDMLKSNTEASYNNGTSVEDAARLATLANDIENLIDELDYKAEQEQNNVTTGIKNATLDGNNQDMYDMSGRKIHQGKGLVIIGKKKYYIK
ncbi:MAG: hypothetical protein PUK76_11170 [Treponema sp.]|nr:hypothetical protein [Treponema sp.]